MQLTSSRCEVIQMKNIKHLDQFPSDFTGSDYPQEIDLGMLLRALWKGKWLIITMTFLFTVIASTIAINKPNVYTSDALLAPTEAAGQGGLAQMAGQLGGLAALAGVSLGGDEINQTELAVQVMQSRQFISGFIQRHDLLVPVMAAKGWETKTDKLVFDNDIYDPSKEQWTRKSVGLKGAKPSLQEAYSVFTKMISISQDKKSGLYRLSIEFYSPKLAKEWTELLVNDINNEMRTRVIKESTKNLDYLSRQLTKTPVAEMQNAFYKIVEEQTKSLMLAKAQDEYVFKIIDPAIVPEVKSGPQRMLITIIGALLGISFGVLISLIVFTFNRE